MKILYLWETIDDRFMIDLCELNDLSNLIEKPTYCKNVDKPTCIDLILVFPIVIC